MSGSVWGWPSTRASMFRLNADDIAVCLNRLFSTLCGFDVALELDDHPHPVAVGLVAQVGDALDPLAVHQLGDLLHQRRLVHLVGQLGDDDRGAARAGLLERDLGPDDDPAAAVGVHLADRRRPSPARR